MSERLMLDLLLMPRNKIAINQVVMDNPTIDGEFMRGYNGSLEWNCLISDITELSVWTGSDWTDISNILEERDEA